MASIEKRQQTAAGKISWRAHYRDPEGKQRSASFATKRDAERFLVGVESDKLRGAFIAPERAAMTVGEIAKTWFAGRLDLAPSTRSNYRRWIDSVIEPKWGAVKLSVLRHSAVQAWVNDLAAERSPATVAKLHRLLSMILDAAVRDERLVRNAAAGVSLPKVQHAERQYLTHAQVDALARECGPYRLAVLFLAYTGIRFGELAALRVGRLDLMRRRARIAESVTRSTGCWPSARRSPAPPAMYPCPGSWWTIWSPWWPARRPATLSSRPRVATRSVWRISAPATSTERRWRSAWTGSTLTRYATPQHPWRSHPGRT